MEFEKAYAGLNAEQRAAVDYIDGPLLVIAGPGTGKTQLLSVRVANILKQTDVGPENILCLTFTEAGAKNMRNRLADFIGPEAYKVQIQTYHGFGSYILQEHRPDLKTAIDEIEQFNLIREIQSKLEPTDILRPEYHTKDIISAISDIKAATLTPADLRKIVQRNQIDNDLMYAAISEDLQQTAKARYPKSVPYYENMLAVFQAAAEKADENILGKVEHLSKIYFRTLGEILADDSKDRSTKLRKWREKYFQKNSHNVLVFGDYVQNKKLLSLAEIMERYDEHLAAHGLFDYNDMILKAIHLLETDDEKRLNIQERFQYILLDEFQDTNDAQAKLVALLTDNPSNEGRPNIMAVGDDDQAIYSFQGANTSNFFDFNEKYQPHHIFLTKNYRSSAEILELADNIIEQSEDRFCKARGVNIDKHISVENAPNQTQLSIHEFGTYQAEYSQVAKEIQALIEQGIPGSQIAVIASKHKYLMSFLPYLHSKDIAVSYERRENILEDPQIQEFYIFAKMIVALNASPRQADPYWLQILGFKCWQLNMAQIVDIIQSARTNRRTVIEELTNSEDENIRAIGEYCVNLAAKATTRSADYILNQICAHLYGTPNSPKTTCDFYNLYSNLNVLRETLLGKAERSGAQVKIADFCQLIEAYQQGEFRILNRSPYHESDNAVQLLTSHSAKGLEFQHVFLIAADNSNWSDAKGNTDKITLPRNLEYVRHTGDSADEKIRVFFVAVTRARAFLHLSYSLSDFTGKHSDRLKYLDIREQVDSNAGTKSLASLVMPTNFAQIIEASADEISTVDLSPANWLDSYMPSDETRKNLLKPFVDHFRLSPTHLNTFIDLNYAGPQAFVARYLIHAPGEDSFAAKYGTFIHEAMDELNKEHLSNDEIIERFIAKINSEDGDDDEKSDMIKRGQTELAKFLAERGDILRGIRAESEYGFFTENVMLGDVPLTGKIDRIEINETDKTITVADFKTSAPKEKWSTGDGTYKYKIQLYFYKFLIENSLNFKNYRVTHGRIDYISANQNDEIAPLELEFKEVEAEEIKHLIASVYHHIKTLDFPDTVDLMQGSAPTKNFIDQLIAEDING